MINLLAGAAAKTAPVVSKVARAAASRYGPQTVQTAKKLLEKAKYSRVEALKWRHAPSGRNIVMGKGKDWRLVPIKGMK